MGPAFRANSSCSALLRMPLGLGRMARTGLSPSLAAFSNAFRCPAVLPRRGPTTPAPPKRRRFGLFAFARHYLRNHFCFLLLRVLRCFSSPRSPHCMVAGLLPAGLPHSEIRDLGLVASPPGFSQLITSFIASESQGIVRLPLLTFYVTALARRIDISQACSSRYFSECTACQRSSHYQCSALTN